MSDEHDRLARALGLSGKDALRVRARRVFKMWHQREPEHEYPDSANFPHEMACIGRAREILYTSNKWQSDLNHFEDYIHECDGGAKVYAARRAGGFSTAGLLNVPNLKTRVQLIELAYIVELTIDDENGKVQNIGFNDALLCSLTDKRTLVILRKSGGPIVVKGSKMRVTARGLVH